MPEKQYHKKAIAAFLVGALMGATLVGVSVRPVAHADTTILPEIFQVGAQLKSPLGPVEILEVQGGWIRVKNLHALAATDSQPEWMYVPSVPGTWIPNDGSAPASGH